MITLQRAEHRKRDLRQEQQEWWTFSPIGEGEEPVGGFGPLMAVSEGRLPPRSGSQQPREGAEIITYVHAGTLLYEDSSGQLGTLHTGEFQRVTAGCGMRYSETNASVSHWAHVVQIWLKQDAAAQDASHEERRFSMGERQGVLRLVASPDARHNSLRLLQDTCLYSAILGQGRHLAHVLPHGRAAWLQIVSGELTLGDLTLCTGDGVGITGERVASMIAITATELLLLDVPQPTSNGVEPGGEAWAVQEAVGPGTEPKEDR